MGAFARHDGQYYGLVIAGIVVGVITLLGLAAIPGILSGIEAWDSAQWYLKNIGQTGALGYLVLYPFWCVWLGRILLLK